MCTVQRGESAPHKGAADDVYGAKRQISTAQESCVGYVRCKRANKHRTEELWRICTVRKDRKTERRKDKKTKRQKDKKTKRQRDK